jgi:hypothetical protein
MRLKHVERAVAAVFASLALVVIAAACTGGSEGTDDRGSTDAESSASASSSAAASSAAEEQSFADEFSAQFGAMSTAILWCTPPFEDSQIEQCTHLIGYLPEVVAELRAGLEARSDAAELSNVAEALDALEEPMQVLAEDCGDWAANGAASDNPDCSSAWYDFTAGWSALESAAGYPDLSLRGVARPSPAREGLEDDTNG